MSSLEAEINAAGGPLPLMRSGGPVVERHTQTVIRATVSPRPFAEEQK
jgi:hypothetical protein